MSNLFDYSRTPALNNSAPPDGSPEGILPSLLNNVDRQMMANMAGAFACYTGGGTANAHTITMDPALAAYSSKVRIAYIPPANNTGPYTVNVNGLGAVSVKTIDGTDPPEGAANSSGVSVIQHNGTNFILLNPAWPTVSGFVSAMRTYLNTDGASATLFDADSNITEDTFESVGPTGSSATNIWTAMDSMPTGTRIAILGVLFNATPSGTDQTNTIKVYARQTGSSAAVGVATQITSCQFVVDDNNSSATSMEVFAMVPLDASRRFDFTWGALADSARTVHIHLKGFMV